MISPRRGPLKMMKRRKGSWIGKTSCTRSIYSPCVISVLRSLLHPLSTSRGTIFQTNFAHEMLAKNKVRWVQTVPRGDMVKVYLQHGAGAFGWPRVALMYRMQVTSTDKFERNFKPLQMIWIPKARSGFQFPWGLLWKCPSILGMTGKGVSPCCRTGHAGKTQRTKAEAPESPVLFLQGAAWSPWSEASAQRPATSAPRRSTPGARSCFSSSEEGRCSTTSWWRWMDCHNQPIVLVSTHELTR